MKNPINTETYRILDSGLANSFLFDVGILQSDMAANGEIVETPESAVCLPLVGKVDKGVSFMKSAAGYFSCLPLDNSNRERFARWGIFG